MSIRGMAILPTCFHPFTGETPVPLALPVAFFRQRNGPGAMSRYKRPSLRELADGTKQAPAPAPYNVLSLHLAHPNENQDQKNGFLTTRQSDY